MGYPSFALRFDIQLEFKHPVLSISLSRSIINLVIYWLTLVIQKCSICPLGESDLAVNKLPNHQFFQSCICSSFGRITCLWPLMIRLWIAIDYCTLVIICINWLFHCLQRADRTKCVITCTVQYIHVALQVLLTFSPVNRCTPSLTLAKPPVNYNINKYNNM